jgi:GT2 family glycosyltransferase
VADEPSPTPTVTAVVLNYDGRHLLEVILPSLAAQSYPRLDIVVVDNGSSDDSREWLTEHWPDLEVVVIPENVGVAAALNRGVAAAGGELVALLNNDLELEPDWVEQMVDGLQRHPEAGTVACKLLSYQRRDVLDGAGDGLSRSFIAHRRGGGEVDRGQFDREEEVLAPTAGAGLYRASALAEVGPFDESFWAYIEDMDWGVRAQLAGLRSWYIPVAVCYHMGSATTGGAKNPMYLALHWRNTVGLIVKDAPFALLRRHWQAILRHQLGTLVNSAQHKRLGLHLRALGQAALRMPGWLIARRRIQGARRVDPRYLDALLED